MTSYRRQKLLAYHYLFKRQNDPVLIFRYLAKEVFVTLVALTGVLLLIFMSNQFVQYLNRAAGGSIPGLFVMKLMMLELPTLMSLLLPLGFYVALLLAYGRLYAESEMTVLQACGYGPAQLLKHSFMMAGMITLVVTVIMLWASPKIAIERVKLLQTAGVQTLIQTIIPGRFRAVSNGQQVFYVETMNRKHTVAHHVFLAQLAQKDDLTHWNIVWADDAYAETDPFTHEDYVILRHGKVYEGEPGNADYQIAEFDKYQARLPHPLTSLKKDIRTASTKDLWPMKASEPAKAAELQWRLSVPLMVLTLTLIAVPLSRVNPRSGKYARLLPAILIYIVYANFMFIARDWIAAGKVPIWIGMWWLHLLVALAGGIMIFRTRVAR